MFKKAIWKKHFFPILSLLTIGFPFAGYKFLAGQIFKTSMNSSVGEILYLFMFCWAISDLIFNLRALIYIFVKDDSGRSVCLLSYIAGHHPKFKDYDELGEAVDMMLSFSFVACVVGGNLFDYMQPFNPIWSIGTVINVLGAGIARLGTTYVRNKAMKASM